MDKVTADTWREEILVDFFKGVATAARCAKCGYKVFELGTDSRALEVCIARLRAECPLGGSNEYVCAGPSEEPGSKPGS